MSAPSFRAALPVWLRIGLLGFGGPAGQIALMHRELVEQRGWIDEPRFLRALNFCHFLPGPEAQQLATYIGWRLHGWRGGLAAGLLFVAPGALVMLALSLLYVAAAGLAWFDAVFLGVKAAVLAIVAAALLRIARRALDTGFKRATALAAFAGLALLALPFPLVVLGAGLAGWLVARHRPAWLGAALAAPAAEAAPAAARPLRGTLAVVLLWGAIWAAPLAIAALLLGPQHLLVDVGAFFARLAVVSFGGAYAVLAYMAQAAVATHGWLGTGEMADGLGLAETTPGPLILVTQFVGFLAGWRAPAPFDPLVGGLLAAAMTLWMTFAPCFLWIFALAPWIERLERARRLQGALAAITAAVVGVIASLGWWFALHLLFARVGRVAAGPLRLDWPDWASVQPAAAGLAAAALLLGLRFGWPVLRLLGAGIAAGLAMHAAGIA